jgi:hypothetical protein
MHLWKPLYCTPASAVLSALPVTYALRVHLAVLLLPVFVELSG